MVCFLILEFLVVTRNKELAGLENIVEISLLVPSLSSERQEGPWEVLSTEFITCCYSSHTAPWPTLQAANSPLQSIHQQGLQIPISRSWYLLEEFLLPLYLEYPVERVSC